MADTTHRVLRLLALLEAQTSWSAAELAVRLDVTERTVRRDVARLRELGYPVEAERGLGGGYRLGAGRRLPPLLLDDDEAVAMVACLRMGALSGADEVGEAALRALAKLDQVLPPRLRATAAAVDAATQALPRSRPALDLYVLQQLATARRDRCVVRFDYRKPSDEQTSREVEPARLMTQGECWYLQAFDRGRDAWRIFRLDRMSAVTTTTWYFEPREVPPAGFQRDLDSRYPCVLEVEMAVDAQRVAARIPEAYRDRLEQAAGGCRFRVGGPTWDDLAWHMLWVSRDLRSPVVLPPGDGSVAFEQAIGAIAGEALNLCQWSGSAGD